MKSVEHNLEKHVSVAASEKCYLISTCPSFFRFLYSTKLQQNICLVKFSSTDI